MSADIYRRSLLSTDLARATGVLMECTERANELQLPDVSQKLIDLCVQLERIRYKLIQVPSYTGQTPTQEDSCYAIDELPF